MTVAYNKIVAKLQAVDEYVRYLKELQKVNQKSFLNDYHFFGLAEHYLHLAIEAILDVGKLIIIAQQFPRPDDQSDILRILYEHHVVNKKLFNQMVGISGFRNILIHEYDKVDKKIVYHFLQDNINQFIDFKKQIAKYLQKIK